MAVRVESRADGASAIVLEDRKFTMLTPTSSDIRASVYRVELAFGRGGNESEIALLQLFSNYQVCDTQSHLIYA